MKKILLAISLFIFLVIIGIFYNFLVSKRQEGALIKFSVGNNMFKVEIADTPAKQAHGLSGRFRLAKERGMLFVFKGLEKRGFWMAGMKFPLDIIWISNGKITGISENLPPARSMIGAPTYYSPEPAEWVLEINAGLAGELGIKAGDPVVLE